MIDKSEMIFGVRAVIEAIQAGKKIDKILVKKDIQSELSKELFAALKGTLIPVQRVPVERINRITRKNHQGVVAFISSVTYQKTEDLVPFLFEEGKNPIFVMLDGITDVRNFGAIARTCECAAVVGADGEYHRGTCYHRLVEVGRCQSLLSLFAAGYHYAVELQVSHGRSSHSLFQQSVQKFICYLSVSIFANRGSFLD